MSVSSVISATLGAAVPIDTESIRTILLGLTVTILPKCTYQCLGNLGVARQPYSYQIYCSPFFIEAVKHNSDYQIVGQTTSNRLKPAGTSKTNEKKS